MAGYIGSRASVVSSGAERKKTFDITTTTTVLTGLSYTPTFVHLFHNGVRLVDGTDYTATNGTSITLTTAAQSGDQVVVVSYATFQAADAYTKAEADAEFVSDPNGAVTVDNSGNVGIGTAPSNLLHIKSTTADANLQVEAVGAGLDARLNLYGNSTGVSQIRFGDEVSTNVGLLTYDHTADTMAFRANLITAMTINSSGGVIAGATDPSYGGAVAGDVVATGGLNLNGMHVIKSKYMNLTTTAQDILICANRATYKITMSACDPSGGAFYGSETVRLSVSNDYAIQSPVETHINGHLVLAWKAGSGYSTDSRTLTARTTSAAANAWVITVEIQSNYARSTEGYGVGSSIFLI